MTFVEATDAKLVTVALCEQRLNDIINSTNVGLFSGTISISSQMTQCRIILI